MTALSCPACGLQQTLAAPRCARCGARLGGPTPAAFVPAHAASPASAQSVADDRTVLRDSLPTPTADISSGTDQTATMPAQFGSHPAAPGRPDLTWTPGSQPPAPTGPPLLQRIWRRIIGEPAAPTQDPPGGAPTESPDR